MSTQSPSPDQLFVSYLEATATAFRIRLGYVPPALASLVRDARRLPRRGTAPA
jgi:hypothetical protein